MTNGHGCYITGLETNDTAVKIVSSEGKLTRHHLADRQCKMHEGFTFQSPRFETLLTNHWRFGKSDEPEVKFARRLVEDIETSILREGPDIICGFIGYAAQANSGGVLPSADYWRKTQTLLKIGRTGEYRAATAFGISPDILPAQRLRRAACGRFARNDKLGSG